MNSYVRAPLWVLITVCVPWQVAHAEDQRGVTLTELLRYAEQHAPALRVASERLKYGDAAEVGARPLLPANPTFDLGIGPRSSSGSKDYDIVAGLSQPLEISGARGKRIAAATRLGARLGTERGAQRWQTLTDIKLTYRLAIVARERLDTARKLEQFADAMLAVAQKRLSAGEVSIIDVRIAESDAAQSKQSRIAAEQDLRVAELMLCELSGWPLEQAPTPTGALGAAPVNRSLAELIALAHKNNPQLAQLFASTREAEAQLAVAKREGWPVPTLGVTFTREGSAGSPANQIVLGTLGLPIPLWQRNQGERARAAADIDVANAQAEITRATLRARIARTHASVEGARQRIAVYASDVARSLEQSLDLLRRGFEAGELSAVDLAVTRERLLQMRRDQLSAYADYYRALAELETAVGSDVHAAGGEQ